MENEDFYAEQFFVFLTIDGTNIKEMKVEMKDTERSIRETVEAIIAHFKLPKLDDGNNPVQYWLGDETDKTEAKILEFTDEEGREMTLYDYDVESGAYLHLIKGVIAGFE